MAVKFAVTEIEPQRWCSVFPTIGSFFTFSTYIVLFINQGLLVTASKGADQKYHYNTVTVVLLTELMKFIAATILHVYSNGVQNLPGQIKENVKVLALYLVPSALYCLYNNLAFINLSQYDPTSYFLLLQFRVVVTGVCFQMLFQKRLSGMQWISILLLTGGCILKQAGFMSNESTASMVSSFFSGSLLLIMLQVFSSCFAGVYNEFLLKKEGITAPLMLQNMFMYLDSVLCNGVVLAAKGELVSAFSADALASIMHWKVLLIICNNAAGGIVTSLFLRSLNSILKTFASALELVFTAVLSLLLFGIPLDSFTVAAIVIVSLATWLYSMNPISNPAPSAHPRNT